MHYEFSRIISLPPLNDFETEADFTASEQGNVFFENVTLGGLRCTDAMIREMLTPSEYGAMMKAVADYWAVDGQRAADYEAYLSQQDDAA